MLRLHDQVTITDDLARCLGLATLPDWARNQGRVTDITTNGLFCMVLFDGEDEPRKLASANLRRVVDLSGVPDGCPSPDEILLNRMRILAEGLGWGAANPDDKSPPK